MEYWNNNENVQLSLSEFGIIKVSSYTLAQFRITTFMIHRLKLELYHQLFWPLSPWKRALKHNYLGITTSNIYYIPLYIFQSWWIQFSFRSTCRTYLYHKFHLFCILSWSTFGYKTDVCTRPRVRNWFFLNQEFRLLQRKRMHFN